MKRLLFFLALLTFRVEAVDVYYIYTDFQQTTQTVKRVTQTPLQPFADYNGAILTPSPSVQITSASGVSTFSNTVPGYAYRIQLDTPFGSTVRTCGFPASLTGYVNGRDYLGDIHNQNFYYLYSTNNSISTNAIISIINSNAIANSLGVGTNTTIYNNFIFRIPAGFISLSNNGNNGQWPALVFSDGTNGAIQFGPHNPAGHRGSINYVYNFNSSDSNQINMTADGVLAWTLGTYSTMLASAGQVTFRGEAGPIATFTNTVSGSNVLQVLSNTVEVATSLQINRDLTNALLTVTNEPFTVFISDTNSIYISGAGTAGANGHYVFKENGSGTRSFWTNTVPAFGIVYNIDPPDNFFEITNTSGVSLYGSQTIGGTWGILNGSPPAPTFSSYATNFSTNYASQARVDNAWPPALAINTNYIFVNPQIGTDQFWRRGRQDRPMLTITNAIANAHSNDTIWVSQGVYTNGNFSLPDYVNFFGAGSALTLLYGNDATTDRSVTAGKRSFIKGFGGSIGIAVAKTDVLVSDWRTIAHEDNLTVGLAASNLYVMDFYFGVDGVGSQVLKDASVVNMNPGNTAFFFNGTFESTNNGSGETASSIRRALVAKGGTFTIYNTRFVARGGLQANYGIEVTGDANSSTTINSGTAFEVSGTGALAVSVTNATPGTTVSNVTFTGASPITNLLRGGAAFIWTGTLPATNIFGLAPAVYPLTILATNGVNPINIFVSNSNTLTAADGPGSEYYFTATTNVAVTNVLGAVSGTNRTANFTISNSSAGTIAVFVTGSVIPSGVLSFLANTNGLQVPSTKKAYVSFKLIGNTTNYTDFRDQ